MTLKMALGVAAVSGILAAAGFRGRPPGAAAPTGRTDRYDDLLTLFRDWRAFQRPNLVGNGRDLWVYGAKSIWQQAADFGQLSSRLGGAPAPLRTDVARAKQATEEFAEWVEAQSRSKTGRSGVGIENYDWYLKNVQL